MADKADLQARSIRVDDETITKLKEISLLLGGNQNDALKAMIQAYELQQAKSKIREKTTEIQHFEKLLACIEHHYLSQMYDAQTAQDIVRAEFDTQIKENDALIRSLQGRCNNAENSLASFKEDFKARTDRMNNDIRELNSALAKERLKAKEQSDALSSKITDLNQLIHTKDALIKNLQFTQDGLQLELQTTKRELGKLTETAEQLNIISSEKKNLEEKLSETLKIVDAERTAHADEIKRLSESYEMEKKRRALDLEQQLRKEFQAQLEEERKSHLEAIKNILSSTPSKESAKSKSRAERT